MSTPSWITQKVDQHIARVRDTLGGQTEYGVVLTTLTEPPEDADQATIDRWERSCDNCGAHCPDGTPFYTVQVSEMVDGTQMIVAFGACETCKDLP